MGNSLIIKRAGLSVGLTYLNLLYDIPERKPPNLLTFNGWLYSKSKGQTEDPDCFRSDLTYNY